MVSTRWVRGVAPRVTGDTVYVCFHGTGGRYSGNYTDTMLAEWADGLSDRRGQVRAIYTYFNNDIDGHAIHNAGTLRELLTV